MTLISVGLGDDVTTFSSECFNITGVISLNITYNGADEVSTWINKTIFSVAR